MNVLPKKLTAIVSALLLGAALTGVSTMSHAQTANPTEPVSMVTQWDKTFAQSDKVEHRKVSFKNRYGITLVADLYLPKNRDNGKLMAIALGGPFGAVKEQSSGLYAQTLAERGFVTLAFDPSYTGESGGQPRNVASPTSIPKTSAQLSISLACKKKSTVIVSVSLASVVGVAWPSMPPQWTSALKQWQPVPCMT